MSKAELPTSPRGFLSAPSGLSNPLPFQCNPTINGSMELCKVFLVTQSPAFQNDLYEQLSDLTQVSILTDFPSTKQPYSVLIFPCPNAYGLPAETPVETCVSSQILSSLFSRFLGEGVRTKAKLHIFQNFRGEQPVGMSLKFFVTNKIFRTCFYG